MKKFGAVVLALFLVGLMAGSVLAAPPRSRQFAMFPPSRRTTVFSPPQASSRKSRG